MSTTLTVECPACATAFPVDPDKVPVGGARTECTVCHTPFRVDDPSGEVSYEASTDPWEDSETEVVEGTIEDVVAIEEVVTVWDADVPSADESGEIGGDADLVEGLPEALPDAVEDGADRWAGDEELPEDAWETAEEDSGMQGGEMSEAPTAPDGTAAEEDDERPEDREDWDASIGAMQAETTGTDEIGGLYEEELDTLEGIEAAADDAFSEMSEALDGLVQREDAVPEGDDDAPLADGIVTDQWSELVSDETESFGETAGFEETADGDAWGGGGDDEEWVVEAEDDGMTVSDLDLEVERLDTVEDQVRAARDEPGIADTADAAFVTDVGEDLLGGNEVVLPEDALEVEGGIAGVGEAEEDGTLSAEHTESAGSDATGGEEHDGEEVFQFGRRDPHDKARRLARVLVSDMITYNPERHEEALAQNRLKEDFEEEIDKSWAEYVEQVGPEIAESTDYWRDALNEILARGEPLF